MSGIRWVRRLRAKNRRGARRKQTLSTSPRRPAEATSTKSACGVLEDYEEKEFQRLRATLRLDDVEESEAGVEPYGKKPAPDKQKTRLPDAALENWTK
ncbi:MAG: hypothetical protein EBS01_05515 [Verrucomicrobia bacterium]|nr:hypothetical protein [Verrucomicrobiota bacterium]